MLMDSNDQLHSSQVRRFACDRCHKHKLKCEREPSLTDGHLGTSLRPCSRCARAKAVCQITRANPPHSNEPYGLKRKSPSSDDEVGDFYTPSWTSASSPRGLCIEDIAKRGFASDRPNGICENPPLLDSYTFDFDSEHYAGVNCNITGVPDMSTGFGTFTATTLSMDDMGYCYPLSGGTSSRGEGPVYPPKYHHEKPTTQPAFADSRDLAVESPTLLSSHSISLDTVRIRVSELQYFLFTRLHSITDEDLAEAIFSPFIIPESINKPTGPRANIIHRLIYASECLLSLISTLSFLWTSCDDPNDSPQASTPNQHGPNFKISSRPKSKSSSILAQHLQGRAGQGLHVEDSADVTEHQHPSSTSTTSMVNLPTVATILTCHVGILSVYRSVFSRIHDALRTCGVPSSAYEADLASPQKKATITCPPSPKKEMLPLNTPCVLGLRVQLEMMTHMLDRMRAAWATAMEGHPSHEDQQQEQEKRQQDRLWLRRRATLETLKSMLALQGHELSCQDSGMGISAVGDLGDKIRRLLRNCDKGMY